MKTFFQEVLKVFRKMSAFYNSHEDNILSSVSMTVLIGLLLWVFLPYHNPTLGVIALSSTITDAIWLYVSYVNGRPTYQERLA